MVNGRCYQLLLGKLKIFLKFENRCGACLDHPCSACRRSNPKETNGAPAKKNVAYFFKRAEKCGLLLFQARWKMWIDFWTVFCSAIRFSNMFFNVELFFKNECFQLVLNVVFFNVECFRRSFSSTAIHRGIGIGRFGVEKNDVRFL